jgi:hypothetical protein
MTIANMHIGVKLELDKTDSLELAAFEPEEIDFWLNNAIRRFVKLRYDEFEHTQKRIDDLRTLTKHDADITPYVSDYPNGYSFNLPSDYWFTLSEECKIKVTATEVESRQGITECTLDEYSEKIEDPFSEHILHYQTAKPIRIYNVNSVELVSDGTYIANAYYLTYLKKPDEVSVTSPTDCNLPEHTHDEIVKLAANMMLENIEQPRYQTHSREVNTME